MTYANHLEFIKSRTYKTNEYYMKGNLLGATDKSGNPVKKLLTRNFNTFFDENLVAKREIIEGDNGRDTIKRNAITRFHPNNIDNKDFWLKCRGLFPLLSICGGECKNIDDVNERTFMYSMRIGAFPTLNAIIEKVPGSNVLEIGCGYGNVFYKIKDKCNYTGIDYVLHKSLKKYGNFIEIDKSGIPDKMINGDLDVIYSVNVLQHCSQNDRFEYFKQGYNALRKGGFFIFTHFIMTDQNKNDTCWGIVDENGRGYTHFFNQLTECDRDWELHEYLNALGFIKLKGFLCNNESCLIMQKI